jgi:hypothetical protein
MPVTVGAFDRRWVHRITALGVDFGRFTVPSPLTLLTPLDAEFVENLLTTIA